MKPTALLTIVLFTLSAAISGSVFAQAQVLVNVSQSGKTSFRINQEDFTMYVSEAGQLVDYSINGRGDVDYDLNGRLRGVGKVALDYDLDSRLRKIGSAAISYDLDGRITQIGQLGISYNLNSQITNIGNTHVSYNLNGRVSRVE
jgi:hypothetical protein